tara:strand:- start:2589 stop:2789 length:201 start_codon:yes stop_codon:yes gene_type:complete
MVVHEIVQTCVLVSHAVPKCVANLFVSISHNDIAFADAVHGGVKVFTVHMVIVLPETVPYAKFTCV